jgi:hypothetical protein
MTPRLRRSALAVLAITLVSTAALPRVVLAQDEPAPVTLDPAAGTPPGIDAMIEPEIESARDDGRRITPLIAPIPFKNTQVGWGLALMLGAIHRFEPDTTIKPSTGALGGFYTENKSWGLMAMEMARFAGDKWRARGVLSHMDVRYDFYGIGEDAGQEGRALGVQQVMNIGFGSVLRRVTPGFYAGASILWMETTVELRDTTGLALRPDPGDLPRTQLFAPGLQAELDTRNDDYWPASGSLAKLKAYFFTEALGGSREFQRYVASWSWYTTVRDARSVLATNVNAAASAGDAPFYALPAVGTGRDGLRGYTQGRYRDRVMATAQAELRRRVSGRFGATMFGGFAQVAPSAGDLFDARVLPAGGLGVRYQLTRQYRMNMRFDYAWGRDGGLLYFAVGEGF